MTVGIYGRSFKEDAVINIQSLFKRLERANVELLVFEPFYAFLTSRIKFGRPIKLFRSKEKITDQIKYLLSIGGDGTLLEAATIVKDTGIPILGINAGRLGFLASIGSEEIDETMDSVLNGNFILDRRSVLFLEESTNSFGTTNFALNELTVHKKDSSSMITIHTYIDDVYLNSYWADGLIVATPTGSTAYSLSCGGPIMDPKSENFVITPIAPHHMNVRPLVVPNTCSIKLKIEGRGKHFLATLDSQSQTLETANELTITRANFDINLMQLPDQNFLKTLKNKLMWGLDKRN